MTSTRWLLGIVVAAGCAVSGHAYVRNDEPPPPREEVVTYRPGFFWVHGHWRRDGDWHWTQGRYERERAGQVYGEGRWEHRGTAYRWVDGGWRSRGGDHDPEDHD